PLSVSWHPNSQMLATGSSDFKCRIFSAFVRDLDLHQDSLNFQPKAFGEECWDCGAYGWVDSVSWSPNGSTLGFTGHDSSVQFVDFTTEGESATPQSIRFRELPIDTGLFLSEKCYVGCGHDMNPLLFCKGASGWEFVRKLEEKKEAKAAPAAQKGSVAAARALFQNKTNKGQDSSDKSDKLATTHESFISCVQHMGPGLFSTSGTDGKLVKWSMDTLSVDMAALGL
ncbi:hypothetical protein TL16_g12403, partial [Triparma laevis f. inornata]